MEAEPGPTIQEFHEMLNSLAKDSGELPNLQTESFTRESFYQEQTPVSPEARSADC